MARSRHHFEKLEDLARGERGDIASGPWLDIDQAERGKAADRIPDGRAGNTEAKGQGALVDTRAGLAGGEYVLLEGANDLVPRKLAG